MARNLDSSFAAQLAAQGWAVAIFAQLTFTTGPQYVWSGPGPFVWNGITWTGVGSLGQIGEIAEDVQVNAQGTSVSLSGIDLTLLGDSLNEIQMGLAAKIWIGALLNGVVVGTPYMKFNGVIDRSNITLSADENNPTATITLMLETRAMNHSRASNRRYTTADQHTNGYPDDTGFFYVETENDVALVWG